MNKIAVKLKDEADRLGRAAVELQKLNMHSDASVLDRLARTAYAKHLNASRGIRSAANAGSYATWREIKSYISDESVQEPRAKRIPTCHCPQHGSWIAADDVMRCAREIDVAINGEKGAAERPLLIDVTAQIKDLFADPMAVVDHLKKRGATFLMRIM